MAEDTGPSRMEALRKRLKYRLWGETAAGRGKLRLRVAGRAPQSAPRTANRLQAARGALEAISEEIRACRKCRLAYGRKRAVPGEGNPSPDLTFVGEAPGFQEDLQGRPFVGPSGALLTRMVAAMGLSRDQVFITNIVKCHPPGNRDPAPEEVASCKAYLDRQIEALGPKVVVTLGAPAAKAFLNQDTPLGAVRGKVLELRGIKVIPTFHPSYLLRYENEKWKAWEDLKLVMRILGLPVPGRSRK